MMQSPPYDAMFCVSSYEPDSMIGPQLLMGVAAAASLGIMPGATVPKSRATNERRCTSRPRMNVLLLQRAFGRTPPSVAAREDESRHVPHVRAAEPDVVRRSVKLIATRFRSFGASGA